MARTSTFRPIVAPLRYFIVFICVLDAVHGAYFGKFLGKLSELHHGVSGEVFAVDARTLYLKDFTYDGQGPAAYFYAGNSRVPGSGGFRLRDENGSPEVIRRYRREGVTLTLPEGKTLNSIKWFSIWCEEFTVNFGDVKIPRNFDYPRPRKIDALRGVHGISSDNIVIVDAQTLLVPNLSYDGEAPDAKFWVGRGPKPSPQGVRVPDENGKEVPLRRYDRKTVVLTLPGDLTVFDIGHFGIWCEAFTVDFGHIQVPQGLNVPPSLKMLGVSPQSKLNCEVLNDDLAFEVRWAVAGDSIVMQLVAKLDDGEYMSFGISGDERKSVMIGGDVVVAWVDRETLKGYAEDYYLDDKSQCSGPSGCCPDNRFSDNTNNIRLLNAALVNGYSIVTYQRPLKASDQFDRQIYANETQPIIWAIGPLNQRQEVSFHNAWTKYDQFIQFGRAPKWNCPMPETEQPSMKSAPQPVKSRYEEVEEEEEQEVVTELYDEPSTTALSRSRNQQRRRGGSHSDSARPDRTDNVARDSEKTVSRTRQSVRRGNEKVHLIREVPTPAPVSKQNAWEIPPIQCYEPEDGVFYAQMGPTGGKRGYPAITGHVGWGISWYINGLLIPEINVVRGKTYTFVVEGGLDPEVPAKYHPFYITDDPIGGYEYKTPAEKTKVKIFAGARQNADGTIIPTGVGRLCHWTHQGDLEADDYESFGAYQRTLELKCDQGEPGVIQFTPDRNTPDTLYYQCFTHRYLGWKINVLDSCDVEPEASETKISVVNPNTGEHVEDLETDSDLEVSPSIQIETRVKAPNVIVNVEKHIHDKPHLQSSRYKQNDKPTPFQTSTQPSEITEMVTYDSPQDIIYETKIYPELFSGQEFPHFGTPQVMVNRPVILTTPQARPKPTQYHHIPYKKPYYIPLMKMNRPFPYRMKNKPMLISPMQSQIRPQALVMKRPMIRSPPPQSPIKKLPPTLVFAERPQAFHFNKLHPTVEVSPPQASTEQEPQRVTEKPSYGPQIFAAPSKVHYNNDYKAISLQPAVNTGFKPESVVVEGGFKPILSKEFQDRMSENGPELEYESEFGIIDVNKETLQKTTQLFEPIFIPSPLDKFSNKSQFGIKRRRLTKKPVNYLLVIKKSRGERSDTQKTDDDILEAEDRLDAFYLPPIDKKEKPVVKVMQPSNIDIPPGTVVSYDGKKVSGISLTAKSSGRISLLNNRSSKAAELIKAGPQFGPFKGDLPPLDPNLINVNAPQLQYQGVLNRELETPPPSSVPQKTATVQGTTKLVLVKQERRRREAHHTPEHIAEQEAQAKKMKGNYTTSHNSSNSLRYNLPISFVCGVLAFSFLRFF